MKAKPRVEVLIDELILHGFAPGERYAIGEALSRELERLMATETMGSLAGMKDVVSLRAGNINLAAGTKAETIGAQAAQSIHASLGARGGTE